MATLNMREVIRSRNATGVISGGLTGLGDIQFTNPSGSTGTFQVAAQSQPGSEYDISLPPREPKARAIKQESEA
ncbi:hypothetical protein V5O48_009300 [Marasmius crinis-equi]|uniref:Uncharacterized protein n=1 Tax=Marasmius crinis-equi TaxID=585013 RepID=A0ABR3FBL1_9AGAR